MTIIGKVSRNTGSSQIPPKKYIRENIELLHFQLALRRTTTGIAIQNGEPHCFKAERRWSILPNGSRALRFCMSGEQDLL